jgi:hypothetical protein
MTRSLCLGTFGTIAAVVTATGLTAAATFGAVETKASPRALAIPFDPLWQAPKQPIELPVGATPGQQDISLPAVAVREAAKPCLRFQVRLNTKTLAGWNPYLRLMIDGQAVDALTAGHRQRLVNRHPAFETSSTTERGTRYCQPPAAPSCFNIFFGPDFGALDPRLLTDRDEGYWYLLDLSGLVRADRPSRLTIVNLAIAENWKGDVPEGLRLVVDNLALGYVSNADLHSARDSMLERRRAVPGTELAWLGGELSIAPGGGLQIHVAGEPYFVETAYSCPSGPDKFNKLSCTASAAHAETGWQPAIERLPDGVAEIHAQGKSYSLVRRMQPVGNCIKIEDRLTNLTDTPLGIRIHGQVVLPDFADHWRLAGMEQFDTADHCVENPTVFVAQKRGGLGLLASDNVLRAQLATLVEANQVRFATDHFGLEPRASYTLRWTLYRSSTDYFDFLNVLRREAGVNFTVEGPFVWADATKYQTAADAQRLRATLQRQHAKLFAVAPWFVYYNAHFDAPWSEYKSLMRQAIRTIKSAEPDALCLALLETNLTPMPFGFFKNTLPEKLAGGHPNGKYGYVPPKAATALLDASPWRDSCLHNANGDVLLDTYYNAYYADRGLNLMVYPVPENHWHREMMRRIAFCLDEVGFDGVYFDQFSLAFGDQDRYSYDQWDGHTVDIDPTTGQITRKYADLGMLSAGARRRWVEAVRSRGKVVVANSTPAVNELQSLPIWRFMEAESSYEPLGDGPPNAFSCARGHLASPIGLGYRANRVAGGTHHEAEIFTRSVIANLQYGLLYYYYTANLSESGEGSGDYGPVNHMFPFTPVELHRGWVLGKERLITCLSGEYPWPYATPPKCHLFDRNGREKKVAFRVCRDKEGCRVTIKLDDWHEIAVLER